MISSIESHGALVTSVSLPVCVYRTNRARTGEKVTTWSAVAVACELKAVSQHIPSSETSTSNAVATSVVSTESLTSIPLTFSGWQRSIWKYSPPIWAVPSVKRVAVFPSTAYLGKSLLSGIVSKPEATAGTALTT